MQKTASKEASAKGMLRKLSRMNVQRCERPCLAVQRIARSIWRWLMLIPDDLAAGEVGDFAGEFRRCHSRRRGRACRFEAEGVG